MSQFIDFACPCCCHPLAGEHQTASPECSVGGSCPCLADPDTELELAFRLMPKLQAIRWEVIQAQAILPRIEGMATLYQPNLRRLCGETGYHLAVGLGTLRATIEHAKHHRPLPPPERPPAWW